MSSVHSLHHNPVGDIATTHPGVIAVGRAGWLAKGVVYVVAGVLALIVAATASGRSGPATTPKPEASPTGALKTIAHATGGSLLLWVLALGMLIYALWRVMSALMPGRSNAEVLVKRIGYLVSAVIYTMFALTAISLARHEDASANGNSTVALMSDRIMAHTGGRLLVGIAGALVIAAGIYRLVKGIHRDVDDELDLSGMSRDRRRWTERFGAVGEVGRGVGIGIVGFFLVRAAITFDPKEATGLDGALRRFAAESWGVVVVILVGAGFVAYGAFCIATFTRRRLQAP